MKLLITLLLLLFPLNLMAADTVTLGNKSFVLKSHPRIMVGGIVTLSDLRAKAVGSNIFWTQMRDHYVQKRRDNPNYLGGPLYSFGEMLSDLETYALMYMVDPVTYADLGQAARELMLNLEAKYKDRQPVSATDWARFVMVSVAKAFDWIYPILSEQDKIQIIKTINDQIYTEALQGDNLEGEHHNLYVTQFNAELIFGLATYEDNTAAHNIGSSGHNSPAMLTAGYNDWVGYKQNYADLRFVGGHSFGGSAYGFNRVTTFSLECVEVLNSALGYDTWSTVPWAEDILEFFMHTTLPGTDNEMYPDGNVGGDIFNTRTITSVLIGLNQFGGTEVGKQTVDWLEDTHKISTRLIHNFNKSTLFFWYNPNLESIEYTVRDTGLVSTGVGLFQARTDWSSNATFWAFSSAGWHADHQGKDSTSFKIWRKGEWLVYENGSDGNGMGVDTNMMFLDDGYVKQAWNKVAFTGGFHYGDLAQDTTSTIDRSEVTSDYNYARGNLTKYYIDNRNLARGSNNFYKLDHFTREMWHLKATDYIVLFDNITSAKGMGSVNGEVNGSEVKKTMRVHVPGAPVKGGATYSYEGSGSKMIARILLPSDPKITIDDLSSDKTTFPVSDDPHRINIVRSSSAKQHDNFLVVKKIGDTAITMPSVSTITGNDIAGMFVEDTNTPFGIVFSNKSGGGNLIGTSFSFSSSNSSSLYIVGLEPLAEYTIQTTGANEIDTNLQVSQAGIIQVGLGNGGNTNLVLNKVGSPPPPESDKIAPVIQSILTVQ